MVSYGLTALAVLVAAVLRYGFELLLGGQAGYLFFIPAVLIGSAFGGWGPGIFATVLGMLFGVLFVLEYGTFTPANQLNILVFVVVGIGASWRGELLRRAWHLASANADAADARAAHVHSILDTVPDAMIVIDDRGVMQSFSLAAERLFGYRARGSDGQNVKMLMPAPYRGEHDGYLARYCKPASGASSALAASWSGSARMARPFRWSWRSARCGPGDRRFFTGFVRDLTERQQTEAASAGAAVGTDPCVPPHRDGRDGLDAGART